MPKCSVEVSEGKGEGNGRFLSHDSDLPTGCQGAK